MTELRAGIPPLPPEPLSDGLDPAAIDPGSQAWKIICIVTDYTAVPVLAMTAPRPASGDTVTLTGRLFGMASSPVELALVYGKVTTALGTTTQDPIGQLTPTDITIPATLAPGDYTITATVDYHNRHRRRRSRLHDHLTPDREP